MFNVLNLSASRWYAFEQVHHRLAAVTKLMII